MLNSTVLILDFGGKKPRLDESKHVVISNMADNSVEGIIPLNFFKKIPKVVSLSKKSVI